MKKSFKICFAISINLLILVACEKDDIVQNNAIVIYSDINNKHIFNLDSTKIESGPREIKTFELDVNQDNINDIQITTDWDIHPGGGYCKSVISCINKSISLCVQETQDTTFINTRIDTVYSGNEIYINYYKTYSCRRISPQDSIKSIEQKFIMKQFYEGDTIKMSDEWQSNNFHIYRPSISSLPYMFENIGNTYKIQNNKTIYDCHNLPFNTPLCLGFKYSDNDNNCLGWLHLVVINSVNIILFEYGYFQI